MARAWAASVSGCCHLIMAPVPCLPSPPPPTLLLPSSLFVMKFPPPGHTNMVKRRAVGPAQVLSYRTTARPRNLLMSYTHLQFNLLFGLVFKHLLLNVGKLLLEETGIPRIRIRIRIKIQLRRLFRQNLKKCSK